MRFGTIPLDRAEGALVAHSIMAGDRKLGKGHRLSAADIADLRAAGHTEVIAARLARDDVPEDAAAARIAQGVAGRGVVTRPPFTGRCNLHAEAAGVVVVEAVAVHALNRIDESVTFATVAPYAAVSAGGLLGTVKIIPFAVPAPVFEACRAAARPMVSVAPVTRHRVGLVQTRLPTTKESVLDKTAEVLAARLAPLGVSVVREERCAHREDETAARIEALRAAGCQAVVVAGASATVDRQDVVPAAVVRCGGRIEHFGMPVDPGNLLVLAGLDDVPVLGMPGCARSPRLNGFDWVLPRLLCDIPVGRDDVMAMGVGGLLSEIPSRPQPRER